jgi:ubiquinone/menaquinone biosynthesis C-methylase UbiE
MAFILFKGTTMESELTVCPACGGASGVGFNWSTSLTEFYDRESGSGNHYIDRASRRRTCLELERIIHNKNNVVLEVGSSSGYLLRDIKQSLLQPDLIGSDCIPETLKSIARKVPGIPLIQFDLINCPLSDNSVDVVIALHVLEHIKDDSGALQQIHRILKPRGYAIIEVPADPELYDFYDEQFKHFRRYNIQDLCTMAAKSGFIIVNATHLGFFLFPAFSFLKKRNKKIGNLRKDQREALVKTQLTFGGKTIHKFLGLVMDFEVLIGQRINFPFGIRCCVLLQRGECNG